MGICLTSRKSSYSFEMGYCGFNNLRTNICKVFDKELGEVYADTLFALNDPQLISQGPMTLVTWGNGVFFLHLIVVENVVTKH